ncbi:unnamed protein product [Linum trigynum]|uniref:Uncharacterized protein n=1 Tax=Linum trigynum TaxID=586398 RepID=A0AAV2EAH5_9ROSI
MEVWGMDTISNGCLDKGEARDRGGNSSPPHRSKREGQHRDHHRRSSRHDDREGSRERERKRERSVGLRGNDREGSRERFDRSHDRRRRELSSNDAWGIVVTGVPDEKIKYQDSNGFNSSLGGVMQM